MTDLIVRGQQPINGLIKASGNKNAALPMIAAAVLTDEPIILNNVPDIRDVQNMLKIAASIGMEISKPSPNSLILCGKNIHSYELDRSLCTQIRTSMLFCGPLLARLGKVKLFPPGGDIIGRRRLDTHFYGLKKLGAELQSPEIPYYFKCKNKKLNGYELFFDEASVTATEHIMMTAVLAEGVTTIHNAAAEPHIQDLGELLIQMGAKISGLGTNSIIITGVSSLHGAQHHVVSDHIEVGSFLALGAATGGDITITGTQVSHYWMLRRIFEQFNLVLELNHDSVRIPPNQEIKIHPDFGNAIPVISDGPWPQYPSDMMSCTITMATQASGTILFFEKMYESRIYFVDKLISMGANAIVCDPHRVVISGKADLHAANITSPDIRAGMAMVIAALCAKGTSIISNMEMINRGYEQIIDKLHSLGADVQYDLK